MAQSLQIPPRIVLSFWDGPVAGSELSPKAGYSLTVGRTRSSKLYIRDTAVSERHAVIAWNGSAWAVRDSGSSNGTAVNGQKLQPLVETVPLKDGDNILFGLDSVATVKLEAQTIGELNVEQLLLSLCEASAQRIEANGQSNAKLLLTELGDAKAKLQERLKVSASS